MPFQEKSHLLSGAFGRRFKSYHHYIKLKISHLQYLRVTNYHLIYPIFYREKETDVLPLSLVMKIFL